MKDKLIFPVLLASLLAFGLVFVGCAAAPRVDVDPDDPASTKIDRSKIKNGESAILFYLDPSMVIIDDHADTDWGGPNKSLSTKEFQNALRHVIPVINNKASVKSGTYMQNIKIIDSLGNTDKLYIQSCQITVPNGHYVIGVRVQGLSGTASDILFVDVDLNNVAVIFKVREATVEEKRAAGFVSSAEAYALDESAIIPLQ